MNDFVSFPRRLYSGCAQYVPDLDMDVRAMFNPKKNPSLEYADIQGFVAYKNGRPAGRVAAMINRNANKTWNTKYVRFGMIEFIDDKDVSAALISTVEEWGRAHGMEKIQGPMGLTDFDKEGMLMEDFDMMGSSTAIYNYPYYPEHMKALGFEKEADWVQIHIEIPQTVPDKYERVSRLSKEMFGLKLRKPTVHEFKHEGVGRKMFDLLNAAYAPLFGFTPMSERQADLFVNQYVPLIDMRLMPMIEDAEGNLIGLAVTMGSLSHALHKSKGKFLPMGWFHLFKALKWKKEEGADMLLVAVRPDYQGLGVNALFFTDLIPIYNKCHFKWAETGPQLEENVKVLTQWKPLNPKIVKRRRCWGREIRH